MPDMPKPRFPFVLREKTRHGKIVWYFRRGKGKRVRLAGDYGSDTFIAAYNAAMAGKHYVAPEITNPNSLTWLIDQYQNSAVYQSLGDTTKVMRGNLFKRVKETGGSLEYRKITRKEIAAGVDRRSATPWAAWNYLKLMRALFNWAQNAGHIEVNPCAGVKFPAPRTEGFHTWTHEEVQTFWAHHKVGTKARLAFDLLLYTGLRRSDVVRLGKQHIRGGDMFCIKTEKSGNMVESWIPIDPALAATIKASKTGDLTFLITKHGKPHTAPGFGNWFAVQCNAAGLKHCRAHGLRKTKATLLAESGATVFQMMPSMGWTDPRQAQVYTRKADAEKLARQTKDMMGLGPQPRTFKKGKG